MHGAVTESRHVFIRYGLEHILRGHEGHLSIFELGFGTGLNALLTYLHTNESPKQVVYTAVEAYPLQEDILRDLNYPSLLNCPQSEFMKFHLSSSGDTNITERFRLLRYRTEVSDFSHSMRYDLVYFDAFGPGTQPNLWTERVLLTLYESMNSGGILVTFCAQGAFKRTLKSIGFKVEALPGPPGKREMTRAVKK